MGSRRHREQRLAGVLHKIGGEDGVIVEDAAVVVGAGHIGRSGHGDHAGHRPHRRQIELRHATVGDSADAEGRVQGVGRQRDVVAIARATTDVQRRALVRLRRADDGAARSGDCHCAAAHAVAACRETSCVRNGRAVLSIWKRRSRLPAARVR